MNWDAIGAVGEILGAFAVVATLAYLAIQMKQNSASLRRANDFAQASSIHETNALYSQVFSTVIQDAQMASIYYRALAGEVLGDIEATRFTLFVNSYLIWAEDLYYQQEAQLGFAAVGDSVMVLNTIGPYMRKLLNTASGKLWWETDAQHHFSPPFFEVVDRVVLNGESLEDLKTVQNRNKK